MLGPRLRRSILLATGLAIMLALALSALSLYRQLAERDSAGGQVDIGGAFSLLAADGQRVEEADFRGRFMLVYFGYTFCPDICPTELATMSRALDLLGEQARQVAPVFITVDPARDTPQVLADYAAHFHESFVMLTGSAEAVAEAAGAYRVYYARAGDPDDPNYLMDHTSFVYLMDREGRYVSHFGPGTTAEEMARRIGEAL